MNEDHSKCPHCGANMKAYWHTLTPGLVSCLIKAIQFVHTQRVNKFHAGRDLGLSKVEYNNFQKLRFHALIAHYHKKNEKSGYWLITARGGQFLRGEISVPRQVKTFRNEVIGHSPELVHINSFRRKVPEFEQQFAYEYFHQTPIRSTQTTLV